MVMIYLSISCAMLPGPLEKKEKLCFSFSPKIPSALKHSVFAKQC